MLVWTCTEGNQGIANNGAADYPTCTSGGAWVDVQMASADFDITELDPAVLAEAFAAGFVVMGTGLVIALAGRAIIRAIRHA